MSTLEIYDTNGNRYKQGAKSKDSVQLERIESLFKNGIKIAVQKERDRYELYLYIRAKPNREARSEQYFARYQTRDTNSFSPSEVCSKIEQLVENEWGYTIDKKDEYFRCFCSQRSVIPGDSLDHRILKKLVNDNKQAIVGVQDASAALGLLNSISIPDGETAVIAEAEPDSTYQWGLAITTGQYSGIQPLGQTKDQWERVSEQARRQGIQEQVASIRDSVSKLSNEYRLSNSEIRNQVHNDIPILRSQSDNAVASTQTRINTTQGSSGLIPSWAQKILTIGFIILLLATATVGGLFYFDTLGSSNNTLLVEVSDAESGESIEQAAIKIESRNERIGQNTTDNNGEHEFGNIESGSYELIVEADGYENSTTEVNITSNSEVSIELERTLSDISVVDAESGEPIEGATVTIKPSQNEESIEGTTNGEGIYNVGNIGPDEYEMIVAADEYELMVAADGYGSHTEQIANSDGTQRIELSEVVFEARVADSTGEPLQAARVGFINEDREYISSGLTNSEGSIQFTASEISRGNQTLFVSSENYENKEKEYVIPANNVVNIELSAIEN